MKILLEQPSSNCTRGGNVSNRGGYCCDNPTKHFSRQINNNVNDIKIVYDVCFIYIILEKKYTARIELFTFCSYSEYAHSLLLFF